MPCHPEILASHEQIKALFIQLGLNELVEKLEIKEDWQKVLSPGEQQRIALIRAIFQKPKWLFLDEATSALDVATEMKAYETISSELPTTSVVSIGHRQGLERFHDRVIDLNESSRLGSQNRRVV